MKNLQLFTKMVESMDGLDVSFKMGKESELVIKGDFMTMLSAFGTFMQKRSESDSAQRQVYELNKKIID